MFERCYDLDGIGLRVTGRGADLLCVVDRLLGPYAIAALAAPPLVAVTIDRSASRPTPPSHAPSFLFPPLLAYATPSGFWLVDDVGELTVDAPANPRRRRDASPVAALANVSGSVAADASMSELSRYSGLTLWVALIECLRSLGRYSLHGAALVEPGEHGRTILLAGTKGAGKSTMTLALLEAGYAVLSDDLLFIEHDQERARDDAAGDGAALTLIGYDKRFHVRHDLCARRPDLAPLIRDPAPYEPQDKKWLALHERFPDRLRRRAAPPSLVFFPEIVDQPRSHRSPLGAQKLLLTLLPHSAFVFVRPELCDGHLAALRALSDGAQGAKLFCGRDLLDDPAGYLALVSAPPHAFPVAAAVA